MLSSRRTTRSAISTLATISTILFLLLPIVHSLVLPACKDIPKVLCCTERVLEKCLSGCIGYITEKCPHKLRLFEQEDARVDEESPMMAGDSGGMTRGRRPSFAQLKKAKQSQPQVIEEIEEEFRRAPQSGDYRFVNNKYPLTEVSDADLTSECGTVESKPPFAPCLSRKTVDDLFLSCCQQHVSSSCHSLCSYEHREYVAAQQMIASVKQDGCDLSEISKVLYCANQNRNNRACCEFLGLSGSELGVGDRCLRMCNVASSGDRVGNVERDDLVCLSNWNVIMYCARAGLRTIS